MEAIGRQRQPERSAVAESPLPRPELADGERSGEKLLVCVGPSPLCESVIRATQRMAARLGAPFIAAYVETPQDAYPTPADRDRLNQSLRLAETLGAEVVTLSGDRVAEALGAYAQRKGVTRIIVGKPTRTRWQDLVFGSLVDEIIRASGGIDVYVTRGDCPTPPGPAEAAPPPVEPLATPAYGRGGLVFLLTTLLAAAVDRRFGLTEVVMVYLLGIVLVALRHGRLVSLAFSALAVAALDFFFVPPRFTFAVSDGRYIFTFISMFVVGLVISNLAERVRWQAEMALGREQRTRALYELTQKLGRERDPAEVARVAARYVAELFQCQALVLLPAAASATGELEVVARTSDAFVLTEQEQGVARWVFDHNALAGVGSATLPEHPALHAPLSFSGRCLGVLALRPQDRRQLAEPEQRNLLVSLCDPIALALERVMWAEEAARAGTRPT